MIRNFTLLSFLILVLSCAQKEPRQLKANSYRVSMKTQDSSELPFIIKIISPDSLQIFNAEEVIEVNEIEYKNDSVFIYMPVFESYLEAKINEDYSFSGYYVKPILGRKIFFEAFPGNQRFEVSKNKIHDISGVWEATFSPNSSEDRYIAKGIFNQKENIVTGTFRTTTGDYRYLEGVLDGNELKLSTFDGSHAFLFNAVVTDTTMSGMFYSGNHWKEPFLAKRNVNYELPNEDSLTFLKEGYDKIAFSFRDSDGHLVSLDDERFKGKVVVVQLMGSWCPNCLDETRYLSDYYTNHKNQGIEFIGLAFEYAKTEELAFKAIKRLKEKIGVDYPILLAQYGSSSKEKAQEKLPMLNHVLSYPTTIFIDKKGQVRKIHTGFNGPATGEKFEEFKIKFESFIDELLKED